MRAKELFTSEGRNDGGLEYEAAVLAAMSQAQVPGLKFKADTSAGFSNTGEGDIEANYNGQKFNIEVKASINSNGRSIIVSACNFDLARF